MRPPPPHSAEHVLEAAGTILASRGLEGLTVRAVSAAAGTTTMAIYSRFGGKPGLLDALFCQGFERLAALQQQVLREAGTPASRLRALCGAYRQLALTQPAHFRLMTGLGETDFAPEPNSNAQAQATFMTLASVATDHCGSQAAGLVLAGELLALSHGLVVMELAGRLPPGLDAASLLDGGLNRLLGQQA